MNARYRIGLAFIFTIGLLTTGPTSAQTDAAAAEFENVLEEVIVTATRRETSVQVTAAAIQAFSGERLEEFGKTEITQFLDAVPGVTSLPNGPNAGSVIIRNLGTSTQEAGSSTTTTYFDDFVLYSTAQGGGGARFRLVDMERVEVIKGPQGTLFGQSAMGGIIRYIYNKPTSESTFGGFNAYISSTTDGGTNFGGHGYLNLPITDDLAVRVVGYSYQDDGYIDNIELGISDHNDEDTTGGRIAVHWDATDEFSLDLTYLDQTSDGAYSTVSTTWDPGDLDVGGDEGPDIPFDVDARTRMAGEPNQLNSKQKVLNLRMDYDFDTFTATFLATRSSYEQVFLFDQRPYLDLKYGCACDTQNNENDTDILEFRLVSSSDGFFDWIAGYYYQDSESDLTQTINWTGPDAWGGSPYGLWEGMPAIFDRADTLTSHEQALYGEVGLHFSEETRLLLGYRRSDVEIGSVNTKADGLWDDPSHLYVPYASQEDVNTYKLSLEHSFSDDVFGYALASSGYRRGGYNKPTLLTDFSTYDSDTLWNYELGLKTTFLEGRLVANVAAYMLDYDDIQLTIQGGEEVLWARTTQNVGKARITGLELDVQYVLNDNWRLGFGGSVSNPELLEDIPGDVPTGMKGDKLPGSATESFSFTAKYNRPLNNGSDLFVNIFYRYVGGRLNDFNTDLPLGFKLPSYMITDLRMGLNFDNGWTVALFADNVFDEAVTYFIDRQGSAFDSVPTNRPRTIGLNFIYNYR